MHFHDIIQSDDTDGDLFMYDTDVVYFSFSPESSDCKEVQFDEINGQPSSQLNVSECNVCADFNFKLDMGASANILPYKYFKQLCP